MNTHHGALQVKQFPERPVQQKIVTWRGWNALISVGMKKFKIILQETCWASFLIHKPAIIPGGGEI
jgi:hypothetical protein